MQAAHQSADQRLAGKGHGGLALSHAAAFAPCLDHQGDAGTNVVLLQEGGHAADVVQVEGRDVVGLGRLHRLGDVGHDGHGVARGHLGGKVQHAALAGHVVADGLAGQGVGAGQLGVAVGDGGQGLLHDLLSPAVQDLLALLFGFQEAQLAHDLGEVGAQGPAAAGAFGQDVGGQRVRVVAGAHDLDGGQAAFPIALHHHDVVVGHAADQLVRLRFAVQGLDHGHLARAGDHSFRGAGLAVTIGVLARDVDLEAFPVVVLDAAHVMAASHQLFDELHHQRGLSRIMTTHNRDCRAWNVNHGSP